MEPEARRLLNEQHGWSMRGEALVREVKMRDFEDAMRFLQRVAEAAVDYGRRPDMCISEYNRVRLAIENLHHAGFTMAEARLAQKVNAILDEHHPHAASRE
jgi:4a-hydroxytetrahydrobiopterin dehydratase